MTRRFYVSNWIVAILAAMLLAVQPGWAQDEPESQPPAEPAAAPAEAAPAEDNKAAETPAAEAPAAAAAADPAAARAEYDATFNRFKEILKEARSLKAEFDSTEVEDADTRDKIRQQFNELLARGNQLLPELQRAGIKAYEAAPNEDRELTRFLVKMLLDNVERDQYAMGLEIGKSLIANNCLADEIYEPTGVAYFALHDFPAAEETLKKAQSAGAVTGKSMALLPAAQEYIELWKKEQELRAAEAEADDLPRVRLKTTKGDIVLELFENEAPGTVGNFISLVENGFYNDLTFHRVLPGFMAQGGCPNGDGSGGPGYNIKSEYGKENARMHFRGSLSMANTGRPNSGGSQFFITFQPTPPLNNRHTVFGRVIEGMDVVDSLTRIDPESDDPQPEPDKIIEATVERKRDHEYLPDKAN
jgi:cyclophilin family peptidyl-prolyl cis-trans isomerase